MTAYNWTWFMLCRVHLTLTPRMVDVGRCHFGKLFSKKNITSSIVYTKTRSRTPRLYTAVPRRRKEPAVYPDPTGLSVSQAISPLCSPTRATCQHCRRCRVFPTHVLHTPCTFSIIPYTYFLTVNVIRDLKPTRTARAALFHRWQIFDKTCRAVTGAPLPRVNVILYVAVILPRLQ